MLLCSYLLAWKKIVSFHQFKIPHGKSSASVHLKADVETQKRKGFFLGLILSYTMGATSHTSFKLYMEEPCHFTISWFIWAEMNALQLKWFAAKWMFRVLSQIVYYRHVFNFSSLQNYRVLFTYQLFLGEKFVSVQIQQLSYSLSSRHELDSGIGPKGFELITDCRYRHGAWAVYVVHAWMYLGMSWQVAEPKQVYKWSDL